MRRRRAAAGWVLGVMCFALVGGSARAAPIDVTYELTTGGIGADSTAVWLTAGGTFTVRFSGGALTLGGSLTGSGALRSIAVGFTAPLLLPNVVGVVSISSVGSSFTGGAVPLTTVGTVQSAAVGPFNNPAPVLPITAVTGGATWYRLLASPNIGNLINVVLTHKTPSGTTGLYSYPAWAGTEIARTAVPEPATGSLVLLGVAVLAGVGGGQRRLSRGRSKT